LLRGTAQSIIFANQSARTISNSKESRERLNGSRNLRRCLATFSQKVDQKLPFGMGLNGTNIRATFSQKVDQKLPFGMGLNGTNIRDD
jgi:hypothetical protein